MIKRTRETGQPNKYVKGGEIEPINLVSTEPAFIGKKLILKSS